MTALMLFTDLGELTIKGEDLHINKLNVESGELSVEGNIHGLSYAEPDNRPSGGGILSRLFR